MAEKYLVEDEERERRAIRLLAGMLFLAEGLFAAVDLSAGRTWALLHCRAPKLSIPAPGDVDLILGRVDVSGGTPVWPPQTDYLIAIEAKCAYRGQDGLKSTKTGASKTRALRTQLSWLLRDGFDRVILLDIIGNPPMSGDGFDAWRNASALAGHSLELMIPTLAARLPEGSPAAHWAWSVGAVAGGTEEMRGFGCPLPITDGEPNPELQIPETKAVRQRLEATLRSLLAAQALPQQGPAVFVDCTTCDSILPLRHSCTGGAP